MTADESHHALFHFINLSIGDNSLTVSHSQEFLLMKYTIVNENIS